MFKWSESDKLALPILFVVIVGVSILLHFILKNKSEKIKQIPLHIVSAALIILEIIKQIYFAANGIYTKNTLPIHFCSFIVVIIAFAQFLPSKVAKWFDAPSVVFPLIAIILVIVHPRSMIGNSSATMFNSFPNFHAFYFHALVIAYPILKLSLLNINLKAKYALSIVGLLGIYCSYAIPLAFYLKNNYLNILYSYFYPLEQLRLSYGQVLYDVVLVGLGLSACLAIYFIWFLISKTINKRK